VGDQGPDMSVDGIPPAAADTVTVWSFEGGYGARGSTDRPVLLREIMRVADTSATPGGALFVPDNVEAGWYVPVECTSPDGDHDCHYFPIGIPVADAFYAVIAFGPTTT
jgi:hypothetical protein